MTSDSTLQGASRGVGVVTVSLRSCDLTSPPCRPWRRLPGRAVLLRWCHGSPGAPQTPRWLTSREVWGLGLAPVSSWFQARKDGRPEETVRAGSSQDSVACGWW